MGENSPNLVTLVVTHPFSVSISRKECFRIEVMKKD
jgi:hypothetical protein